MVNGCFTDYYKGLFPDKRIEKRLEKTLNDLLILGTAVVNKMACTHSNKIGIYRMLSNERFDHNDILEGAFRKCASSISTNHVLAIQDTTEFNYQGIKTKISKSDIDIGPTSVNSVAGYFCHPMLIIDPINTNVFGISSAIIYNRLWDKKDKKERKYAQLPIEQKESYRWIKASEETKERLPENVNITIIGDRENDIYEDFIRIPDSRTNLLIRSRCDRILSNSSMKLYEKIDKEIVQTEMEIPITSTKNRKKRIAKIELKFCKVSLSCPSNIKSSIKHVEMYAVEARESNQTKPKDEDPILWRLLTTHKIETVEQAIECVDWYKKRWLIEELFRVIKTKGFCIESSQLGSGFKLKKLLALTLEGALHIMRLKLSLNQEETSADLIFSKQEQDLLLIMQKQIEGETEKQKNPYPKLSLSWAAWSIARIAGWSGYKSHGPPGYITMKDGYDRFHAQLQVYNLILKDVYKD